MGIDRDVLAWVDGEAADKGPLDNWQGEDWWQLSPAEGEVFEIELREMPRLVAVYQVYQALKGMSHNELYGTDLCTRARQEWDIREDRMADIREFTGMAQRLGVKIRKAIAIYYKMEIATLRSGWVQFPDEEN